MPVRLVFALLMLASSLVAQPRKPIAPLPISPTHVTLDSTTLVDAIAALKKSGFDIDASALDAKAPCQLQVTNVPFFEALEAVAEKTGSRIELQNHGKRIVLMNRVGSCEVSCVRGPFRIFVKQVTGRLDFATGHSFKEVQMEVHWEPRFPVFRIDSVPAITRAKDDLGNDLAASSASALSPVSSASSHSLPVRLLNVPRKAIRIAEMKGHFSVTASERMLPFAFTNLGGKLPAAGVLPAGVNAGNVTASLTDWQAAQLGGKTLWEATIKLEYPAGMPVFQSFETWLGENKLRLVSPQGIAIAPDQVEEPGVGREMTVVYRFDAAKIIGGMPNGKGWSLVYDTPAPLVEFKVPFELKDVPLP